MKNPLIKDLKNLISKNFNLVDKSIGVELVDTGFLNYKKLSSENYNYWWYEVEDIKEIDRNKPTYKWEDLERTRKFKRVLELVDYHHNEEPMYTLLNNILQIESASNLAEQEYVFNTIYGEREKITKAEQLEFLF